MRSCVYCKRRYKKNSEISFHRFPKDFKETKVWLLNMKSTNWTPKTYDSLCSLHFTDECFDKHFNRTTLKPYSIPTIFEGISTFPSSPCLSTSTSSPCPSTSTSSPRPSISTSLSSPSTTKLASIGTISTKRKSFCDANIIKLSDKTKKDQEPVTDHDYKVSSTPEKARIKFGLLHDHCYAITPRLSKKVAQQTNYLKFSKFKALSQSVRRLKLKVANIKSILNDLIKKKKINYI